jgi:hypothetical protein
MPQKKIYILVPTLVLVALFLLVTPLKLVNKTAHMSLCSHNQGKQEFVHKKCFSPSLVSQNDFDAAVVDTSVSYPEASYGEAAFHALPESSLSKIRVDSIPLRC